MDYFQNIVYRLQITDYRFNHIYLLSITESLIAPIAGYMSFLALITFLLELIFHPLHFYNQLLQYNLNQNLYLLDMRLPLKSRKQFQ